MLQKRVARPWVAPHRHHLQLLVLLQAAGQGSVGAPTRPAPQLSSCTTSVRYRVCTTSQTLCSALLRQTGGRSSHQMVTPASQVCGWVRGTTCPEAWTLRGSSVSGALNTEALTGSRWSRRDRPAPWPGTQSSGINSVRVSRERFHCVRPHRGRVASTAHLR